MNLKLDENVPHSAIQDLTAAGHDVSTVPAEDLTGAPDRDLAEVARHSGRMLVPLDRGLGDLRMHPPGSHPGILVLRLRDQSAPNVRLAIRRLLGQVQLESFEGCIVILEEDRVRVRRPSPSVP